MAFYHNSPTLQTGDEIVVVPEALVPGGAALARVDGLPVFIAKLFPGDQARIRIVESKKGFARGEVIELLHEGPMRRAEPCPVAQECGGCDWTALRLDLQLDAKRAILLESIRRVGKMDPAALPEIRVHASPLNYRLRSRLQVENGEMGFFALGTHRVVPLPEACEVVGPAVISHLNELREKAKRLGHGEIETLENAARFVTEPRQTLTLEVDGFRFDISTDTFFQVNRHLLSTLLRLVRETAERAWSKRVAWDLYSGVGFFTLPLARIFKNVTGVEESSQSHRLGVRNAAKFPNVRLVNASVETFLRRAPREVDFLFADPPRAGLSPGVVEKISVSRAPLFGYLSCDPVTFSRDASRLVRRGWSIASLDLIDLFPNTHHVETLASFTREGSRSR